MKITGDYTFEASRQEVWEALLDPDVLAKTLPGCEDLKQSGENEFEGKLTMKVGPVQGVFQGQVALSDLNPPKGYRLSLKGKGAPGFVNGQGNLELEETPAGATRLHYDIDAQVGGRIASVGQRLLDSSAKVITRQALEGLDQQIQQRRTGPESGVATPAAPEAPSQTQFVAGFVGGLLGELIPKQHRALVAAAAVGLLLVVTALVLRSCS